ncbi:MAG TPA: carboxypeptidase regulatory-like domain-containing protein, partial [Candidatus Acidoferrales bacterium]|nr:carboxypeptidase regulatory-like domain-containing protein [Candidatus Acidoferrales bacterium]
MTMEAMRRYGMACLAVALALLFGLDVDAAAQAGGTGQVVGTVYDAGGGAIPDAKVTLNSKATGLTREETSNAEAQYRFILVPIGNYTVTFSKTGFKTYKADIEVTVGAALTVNAQLELGDISQVVEVTASTLVESTAANPDALIGVRPIEELPINGRRFQDFATLTPSVQIEPQRNGISFVGQRGINGNVTIDGADYNEPFFGGIRGGERSNNAYTIPQEAISQFQVVNYGYSVEFGRSSGGILNATTKSGTNNIHGSAFFFARNGSLAKDDAFGRQAISTLYQEGASLGGDFVRDKLFYFAAFERQTNDNPRVVVFHSLDPIVPSTLTPAQTTAFNFFAPQQGPFTQTNDALTGFGRLDYQFNPNHRVSGSYHYSKNTGENAVSTGDAIAPETNRAQSNNGTEGDRTNTVVGQWTAIFSPRVVLETRGQYSP